MNYLEKYTQPVEELMKLTRNKRHFYQRGLRTATLLQRGKVPSYICHPPSYNQVPIAIVYPLSLPQALRHLKLLYKLAE